MKLRHMLLSFVLLYLRATPAQAYLAMPNEPVAHKIAAADCAVLGKIVAIRPKPEEGQVWRHSAAPRWPFTVVEVEVQELLHGPRDVKRVRFGFKDGKATKFAVGDVGCFFGVKIAKNDFYIVPLDCFCEQKTPAFAQDLATARRLGRLMAEPEQGLNAKDADDRLLTAYLLLLRSCYVPWRHGETGKVEPLDAAQSKRILLALADGDWSKQRREVRDALAALQLAAKFGAPALQDFPQQADERWDAAAKEWLKRNAEGYRIHRLLKRDKT